MRNSTYYKRCKLLSIENFIIGYYIGVVLCSVFHENDAELRFLSNRDVYLLAVEKLLTGCTHLPAFTFGRWSAAAFLQQSVVGSAAEPVQS